MDAAAIGLAHVIGAGRLRDQVDEGLVLVGAPVQVEHGIGLEPGGHVTGGEQALLDRDQVRHEREAGAVRKSVLSRLGAHLDAFGAHGRRPARRGGRSYGRNGQGERDGRRDGQWDGRNDNGEQVPNDVYVLVLQTGNGNVQRKNIVYAPSRN